MSSDDIPGFYYDSEKKRYFKISKEELPDFVTRGTVNSKRAHNESARIARDLLSRCASTPSWTALQHLGLRERMLNRSWDSSYHNLLQSHVKNMRHQFTSNLIHGKCVLSPDTRKLFVLTETSSQSCSLIMYSTSYGSSRVRCEVKPRFTYSVEQQYVLPLSFQGLDLTWIDPGRKLAVLACKSGQPIVLVLNTDDGLSQISGNLLLPLRACAPMHFVETARSTDCSYPSSYDNSSQDPLRLFVRCQNKLCFSVSRLSSSLDLGCIMTHSIKPTRTASSVTACCEASTFPTSDASLFYVASSTSGSHSLNLLQFSSFSIQRNERLLTFSVSSPSCTTSDQSDLSVTFLRSLVTPSGHRYGLLVGRRCGLLQLWDERWPACAAVEYHGSDAGSLCHLASHLPPIPSVPTLESDMVAVPLVASAHIALWTLRTGKPIHVLEIPQNELRAAHTPPPQIFFRPGWSQSPVGISNGPTLVAVERGKLYWFHEGRSVPSLYNTLT